MPDLQATVQAIKETYEKNPELVNTALAAVGVAAIGGVVVAEAETVLQIVGLLGAARLALSTSEREGLLKTIKGFISKGSADKQVPGSVAAGAAAPVSASAPAAAEAVQQRLAQIVADAQDKRAAELEGPPPSADPDALAAALAAAGMASAPAAAVVEPAAPAAAAVAVEAAAEAAPAEPQPAVIAAVAEPEAVQELAPPVVLAAAVAVAEEASVAIVAEEAVAIVEEAAVAVVEAAASAPADPPAPPPAAAAEEVPKDLSPAAQAWATSMSPAPPAPAAEAEAVVSGAAVVDAAQPVAGVAAAVSAREDDEAVDRYMTSWEKAKKKAEDGATAAAPVVTENTLA